jgi:hypothetical protein
MRRPLNQLPPGTRFRQPELDLTGTLLMAAKGGLCLRTAIAELRR